MTLKVTEQMVCGQNRFLGLVNPETRRSKRFSNLWEWCSMGEGTFGNKVKQAAPRKLKYPFPAPMSSYQRDNSFWYYFQLVSNVSIELMWHSLTVFRHLISNFSPEYRHYDKHLHACEFLFTSELVPWYEFKEIGLLA